MLHSLLLAAALSLGGAHGPLHPAKSDVFIDVPAPQAWLAARERAPWNKLFADEEMKKLAALLEGFGVSVQAISDTAFPAELFGAKGALQALQHASLSVNGLSQSTGEPKNWHYGVNGVLEFTDAHSAEAALVAIDAWKILGHVDDPALAKECKLAEHACALHWYSSAGSSGLSSMASVGGAAAEELAKSADSRVWITQNGARLYLGALEATPDALAARLSGKEPGLPEETKLFTGTESWSPSSGTPLYRLWCDLDYHGMLESGQMLGFDEEYRTIARWVLPTVFTYPGAKGMWRVEMRGDRFATDAVYKRYPAFENKVLGSQPVDPTIARFVPKEAVGAWLTSFDAKQLESESRSFLAVLVGRGAAKSGEKDEAEGDAKTGGDAQAGGDAKSGGASKTGGDANAGGEAKNSSGSKTGGDAKTGPDSKSGGSAKESGKQDQERERLAAEREAGRKILEQLPPLTDGLGAQTAIYLLPINNLQGLVPRAFVAVELKDKARFEAALNAWAAKLAEIAPSVKVTNKPYRKQMLVSIAFGKEEEESAPKSGALGGMTPDFTLSPSIAVLDDRVLFALKKTYAQAETRRVVDAKASEPHPIASPGRIPKDAFEASTMDWGGFFGKLLDVAKGLAPMAAGFMGENAPQIDANALPGSATLARYFQPTTSWSKRLADGRIYSYGESSFGPETPLEMFTMVAAASTLGSSSFRAPKSEDAGSSTKPESAAEPAVDKPALATQAALLSVKTAIAVYRSQANKVPAKLEELLLATSNFPDGFLSPKEVPLDGWGHALAYKPEADGKKFLLYSFGPNGKDDNGAGDDMKAP